MDKNRPEIHVLQIRLKILNKLICQLGRFLNVTFCRIAVQKIHLTLLDAQRFYLTERRSLKITKFVK
jgi:hypothetical protein